MTRTITLSTGTNTGTITITTITIVGAIVTTVTRARAIIDIARWNHTVALTHVNGSIGTVAFTLSYAVAGARAIVTALVAIPASLGAITVIVASTSSRGIARRFERAEIVDNGINKRFVNGYFTCVVGQFRRVRPPAPRFWLINAGVHLSKGGKYPFDIDCLF
jgi:hypothetical protein